MDTEQLRQQQAPLKQQYRDQPDSARVRMVAGGTIHVPALECHVPTFAGTAIAGLHPAAGGDGSLACSGDMLLQALVACSGVTLAAVATAMGIAIHSAAVQVEAEMDFRGTLGVDKNVAVGITSLHLHFQIDSPADEAQLHKLVQLTERYCVVLQTISKPATLTSESEPGCIFSNSARKS